MNANFIPGSSLRMSHLFDQKTQRSVCVAIDHGFGGTHPGLEKPEETLTKLIDGQPDGILITPGTARTFQSLFAGRTAPAMILSIDYVLFHTFPGSPEAVEEQGLASSVEEALRLGADAIKLLMIFGRKDPGLQARNFDTIGRLMDKSHQWGLPVMVEPTTWGHQFTDQLKKDKGVLRDMARIAFEFGADIVKSDYPKDPMDMGAVVESCPAPVLALGGTKKDDAGELIKEVDVLIQQGAAGVTFGRNVWQHDDPSRFIRALKYVVHDRDVNAAVSELKG